MKVCLKAKAGGKPLGPCNTIVSVQIFAYKIASSEEKMSIAYTSKLGRHKENKGKKTGTMVWWITSGTGTQEVWLLLP